MFNLFKRKDAVIESLISTIDSCKTIAPSDVQEVSDSLFDSLARAVRSKWTNEHRANYRDQIQAGESPEAFIYNFIIHACGDKLESGDYHIYLGVLNYEGDLYRQLLEHSIATMVSRGEYTKAWATKNLYNPIINGIREIG